MPTDDGKTEMFATAEEIEEWDEENDEPHPIFEVEHRPERQTLNAPDDTMAGNFPTYIIDGTLYIVARDRLWRRTGQTHNPRVIALADAVGSGDGALLTVHTDGATVLLQHHIAGIEERLYAGERTDWCYVTFEEVETLW